MSGRFHTGYGAYIAPKTRFVLLGISLAQAPRDILQAM